MPGILYQKLYSNIKGSWREYFPDYPTDKYDLKILLKSATNPITIINAAKDGDEFVINYENLIAGYNSYQYLFTNLETNENTVAFEGVVEVKNLLDDNFDARNEDQKVLDELIAARLRVAKREYVEININGKATRFKTLDQIDKEIVRYKKKLGLLNTPKIIQAFR